MIFLYLSAEGGKYVRKYFNPEVYHIDNIKGNSCFTPTTNLKQSYYFLKNVHGTFVALDKLITSCYSTAKKKTVNTYNQLSNNTYQKHLSKESQCGLNIRQMFILAVIYSSQVKFSATNMQHLILTSVLL